METKKVNINQVSLTYAKQLIETDELVAFPTETVYGLGGSALSDKAIEKIFEVKGRPADNPLIIHVHKDCDISMFAFIEHDYTNALIKKFMPGPLTLVLKSKGIISKKATCGLDTVAVRMPADPSAQDFLKFVNIPIAAPSANISSHVSAVSAQHVLDDFDGKIPLILDGGDCQIGIESTVLDCTQKIPVILRQGAITEVEIKEIAGEVIIKDFLEHAVRSPGVKYRHYHPKCETILFERGDTDKILETYGLYQSPYILCDDETAQNFKGKNILPLGKTNKDAAKNLYARLREGEKVADIIIAVALKSDADSGAVMNRMRKACQ